MGPLVLAAAFAAAPPRPAVISPVSDVRVDLHALEKCPRTVELRVLVENNGHDWIVVDPEDLVIVGRDVDGNPVEPISTDAAHHGKRMRRRIRRRRAMATPLVVPAVVVLAVLSKGAVPVILPIGRFNQVNDAMDAALYSTSVAPGGSVEGKVYVHIRRKRLAKLEVQWASGLSSPQDVWLR